MKDENFLANDGVTFKSLWEFVKKALPYMLVSVIITVLIGVAVTAVLSEVDRGNNEQVQAVFELAYDTAEEGLLPNGQQLDVQKIKAIGKINQVINKLNLDVSAGEVQSAIVITGYYSPAIRQIINAQNGDSKKLLELVQSMNLNFTQFMVSMDYKKVSNLQANDAVNIIDNLLAIAKTEDFVLSYNHNFLNSVSYEETTVKDLSNIDKLFFMSSEIYKLESYVANSNKFTPANKILINSALKETKDAIDDASYYLLSNGVFVDDIITLDSQITKIERAMSALNINIAEVTTRISEQTTVIEKMIDKLNIIVNDKGDIISGSFVTELYNEQYRRLNTLQDIKANYENEMGLYKEQKVILDALKASGFQNPSDKAVEELNNKVAIIYNNVKDIVSQIESNMHSEGIVSNTQYGLKISLAPAVSYSSSFNPSWIKCLLISGIVGILIGFAITYPINKVISKKKNKKKVEPAQSDSTAQ